MQSSSADGGMMDWGIFEQVVAFAERNLPLVTTLSGGEPTEHPMLLDMCKVLQSKGLDFTICSNGMFLKDNAKVKVVSEILKMNHCIGLQIYSHRDFYKDYDFISRQRFKNKKICLTLSPILAMQDLGRAKTSEKAQEYIRKHNHHVSCLNGSLIARQTSSMAEFIAMLNSSMKFCNPLIDIEGNIHLSESWHCPSIGNVFESDAVVFERMHAFKPCGGCGLYQRLFVDDARLEKARQILDLHANKG